MRKHLKNGARECPYCGVILDPGEICDCRKIDSSLLRNCCDWCGGPIVGKEYSIVLNDDKHKICFRCNLAVRNLKTQREALKKI